MKHFRLPHYQQWHLSIGPAMTLRPVSWHGRGWCQVSIQSWQLACGSVCSNSLDPIVPVSWKIMDHPPYSPDLAHSDFHCFEPLKKQLADKWFVPDTNLKQVVTPYLQALDTKFLVCDYTSISVMVGQTLICLLWLDGVLMCTICYQCALYTWKIE